MPSQPKPMPPLTREPDESLTDALQRTIMEAIDAGIYLPEDRLPTEAALCEWFDVSRISVREALQRLRALGVITSVQGRGTFVQLHPATLSTIAPTLSLDDTAEIEHLLDARLVIERECATRACHALPEARGSLSRMVVTAKQLYRSDMNRTEVEIREAALARRFHRTIGELSDNPVLDGLLKQTIELLEPIQFRTLSDPRHPDRWWNQRRDIADAIESGDEAGAAMAVTTHLECFAEAVLRAASDLNAPEDSTVEAHLRRMRQDTQPPQGSSR